MKIECPTNDLLRACQLVAAAAANRGQPVLCNIKALAVDDKLTLTTYDPTEGVGIEHTLASVGVPRSGLCILAKEKLIQILREAKGESVAVSAGKDSVTVKSATSRYELPVLDVQEFPDLPSFAEGSRHELSVGTLRTMIRRTAFAASRKDATARFALTGVLWDAWDGFCQLVATDTKRLAVCKTAVMTRAPEPNEEPPKMFVPIVPLKAIGILERNLTDDGELVRVSLRTSDAQFSVGNSTIYTALLQGKFPAYRDHIAKARRDCTREIVLSVSEFAAKVRQAAIMTDDESCRVDFAFEPGKVTLSARGASTGASEVELKLPDYAGDAFEIAFAPEYLLEFLKAVDGEESVVMKCGRPDKAALFTCGESLTYLVMPLTG